MAVLLLLSQSESAENSNKSVNRSRNGISIHTLISSVHTTAWLQDLSYETSSEFLVALDFGRHSFLKVLLPVFEEERLKVNFDSPY